MQLLWHDLCLFATMCRRNDGAERNQGICTDLVVDSAYFADPDWRCDFYFTIFRRCLLSNYSIEYEVQFAQRLPRKVMQLKIYDTRS